MSLCPAGRNRRFRWPVRDPAVPIASVAEDARNLALAGSLLFGFPATWWKFSTDANAYIPSILLLLCTDYIQARRLEARRLEARRLEARGWRPPRLEARRSTVVAGLAHAGAMLFHELAILFLPVALFRLRKNPELWQANSRRPSCRSRLDTSLRIGLRQKRRYP